MVGCAVLEGAPLVSGRKWTQKEPALSRKSFGGSLGSLRERERAHVRFIPCIVPFFPVEARVARPRLREQDEGIMDSY